MDERIMVEGIAKMMEGSRVTLDALADYLSQGKTDGVTVSEYRSAGITGMEPASRPKHRGYVDVLVNGLPGMCWCLCIECVTHREPESRIYTCPCTDGGCNCPQTAKITSEAPVLELTQHESGKWTVTSREPHRVLRSP